MSTAPTPAFPISLPLSLARFLSSVSLDHISGIRRHINNHLNLLLNSLTRSSFPLPHPLPSFLAFNTFLPFHATTSNRTCTSQDTTTQSDVPVGLAVASSLQRRSPPGSHKLKLKKIPVPRSRQLALVRAHQPLLRLPSPPLTTSSARTKTPNKKSQMAALRLQAPFNRRPSQQSPAPAPVLVRRAMASRPPRGLQLERSILPIRRTRPSGWDHLQHMDTNKLAIRIGSGSSDRKTRNRGMVVERCMCMIRIVVVCWLPVWSASCALCCSPRFAFAYVFAFLFLALDGVLDSPSPSVWDMPGHAWPVYNSH